MKAKTFSLVAKIISGVLVIAGGLLVWFKKLGTASVPEVIQVCTAMYCFLDAGIQGNMISEKWTGRKDGVSVKDKKEQ